MNCDHKVIIPHPIDGWCCVMCSTEFIPKPAEKPECVCRPCHRYGDANPAGGMICECLCHEPKECEVCVKGNKRCSKDCVHECHKPKEWKPTKEQIEQSKRDHELVAEMLKYPRCACHNKLIEHCPTEQERRHDAFWGKPSQPLEGETEEQKWKRWVELQLLGHERFRRELLKFLSDVVPPKHTEERCRECDNRLEDLRRKFT